MAYDLRKAPQEPIYLLVELRGGIIERITLHFNEDSAVEAARAITHREPLDDDDDAIVFEFSTLEEGLEAQKTYSAWDDLEERIDDEG